MALNKITFTKGQGGLGRPLPGRDHVSGLVFYTGTLPSGFSSSDRIKKIFSVEQAEDLGVVNDYSDETKAQGTYLVTNPGALNDTINLTWLEYPTAESIALNNPTGIVNLGTYTRAAGDTTAALLAASITAFINAGSFTHGYTASLSTATVSIIARPGLGTFPNTGTPIVATIVGTIAGTLTQPTGAGTTVLGIASLKATWHYHISEFFRMQPLGELYLAFYAVPSTYDFTDLILVQQYAQGEIRQFAVYCDGTTYTSAKVQAAQAVATTLEGLYMYCQILVTFNYAAATLSTLADLSGLNSKNVSVVIGQDGFATGYKLWKAVGKSITSLGTCLGTVSLSKVNEDIAWRAGFNLSDGTENDVAAFANGVNFSSQTDALLGALNDYRYIFIVKDIGFTGTYFNDSHCAILSSSDYAYIENNRTIDKAQRLLRPALLPYLNSTLVLNADGTLSNTTLETLIGAADEALEQMERDQEVSAAQCLISSTQNVLSTNKVVSSVEIVGTGVMRNLNIKIKYVQSLS